jgi:hypothetical protein
VDVPADIAVTKPAVETVATEVLLLPQFTFIFVALEGDTVAVNWRVEASFITKLLKFRETSETETVKEKTVITQVAVLFPSSVVTVIVAVPAETAFTSPVDETVATEGLSLFQLTYLLSALEGETVAVN